MVYGSGCKGRLARTSNLCIVALIVFGITCNAQTGATSKKGFTLSVSGVKLDQYGGFADVPSPNGGSGFFRVEKFGNRWMFVTPAGNAFWMRSVYVVCPGALDSSVIPNKYGGVGSNWGNHTLQRLLSWGFNTVGEFSSTCTSPMAVQGGTFHNNPQLPIILFLGTVGDAMFGNYSALGLSDPLKNISTGIPSTTWTGWRGALPDVYAPGYATASQAEVTYWMNQYTGGFADKPWVVGISTDDADYLFGFKSGGAAPVNNYPHPGYMVATVNFNYSSLPRYGGGSWVDPKLYSKYAWINYLKAKYSTISSLNSNWGTGNFYTSFDDAGGFGTGTGVIDEDGRHSAWMGNDPYTLDGTHNAYGIACSTCTAPKPAVKADLDTFLYQFAKQYMQTAATAIRAVDKNHMIFGPAALNNYGAKARDQILKGLSDGGQDVFQFNYDPIYGPMKESMADNNKSYDVLGKPAYIWYSVISNEDSPLKGSTLPYGAPEFPSQAARGNHYATVDIPNFLNAQGSNGDYYVVGFDWWGLYDDSVEKANWGLLTKLDNVYDGRESVTAKGADSWGFKTGGEAGNYGNFMDQASQANFNLMQTLVNQLK